MAKEILRMEDVTKIYDNGFVANKNVTFWLHESEILALVGENGAGKTTTLKLLSGILYPTSGEVLVNGFVPWERKNEFKRSFAIVMGQKNQLWWDLPASDSLYLNKCIYDVDDREYKKTVDELSELLGVRELMNIQVRRLSLGERMKMEILAALIHRPGILFLDEPTIGLDIVSQQKIRDFLQRTDENIGHSNESLYAGYRSTLQPSGHY